MSEFCEECAIERTVGPCPHDAVRAVKAYGCEQYARGLRAGLDALLDLLTVVDGHQEKGKRRRPIPLPIVRGKIQSGAARIISALREVDYPKAEEWKAEARKAFDGEPTCDT